MKNVRLPKFLFPKVGFQMMCYNPMRLWHIFQNDRSHEIMTHELTFEYYTYKIYTLKNKTTFN
jgi:hypothetical protein